MRFKDIEKFVSEIDYSSLMVTIDGLWAVDDDTVYWLGDKGDVFSAYMPEGSERKSDYFIANSDTESGYWVTNVFKLGNETMFDEFENKYGDLM